MKRILLLATLVLGALQVNAQDMRVGLQFSPTLSTIRTADDYQNKSSKISYSWGLRVERKFDDKNFSFLGGVDITRKGGTLDFNGIDEEGNEDGTKYSGDYVAQYIEIPLAAKMFTRQIGLFSYWFNLGLVPSVKIGEKSTLTETTQKKVVKSQNEKLHQPLGLGLLVGGGIQYEITEGTDATLGLLFNNGFTNMTRNHAGYGNRGAGFNYFALQMGILF
jgi:hypothetical protein